MSDPFRQQLKQRLESLRLAGVQYLPRVELEVPSPVKVESPAPVATPQAAEIGIEPRRMELKLLAQKVAQCSRCPALASTRTQTVFGVGSLDPDLCFIGEAPGADEDRKGEPFVGAAGQLLDKIIAAMGFKRDEVYICNILRCRPAGNRPPQPAEADNCREWLDATLTLVRPKHICCLGASAAKHLLRVNMPISRMRKQFYEYGGIPVMCTYHPSYLLRQEGPAKDASKREVWEDMKMLLAKMGREVPTAKKND